MNILNQIKQLPRVWWHILLIVATFYALPLISYVLPADSGVGMLLMLFIMPLCCFVISVFVGKKIPFNAVYAGIVALLFVPSIFIFYNYTAWFYVIAYGLVATVGNIAGKYLFIHNK